MKKSQNTMILLKEILEKQLNKILPENFEQLSLSELNLDSLERLTLMVELENRLQVTIESAWAYELNTVADLANALGKIMGDQSRV